MSTFEKLRETKKLLDEGIITEDEFQQLKARLMNDLDKENSISVQRAAAPAEPVAPEVPATPTEQATRSYQTSSDIQSGQNANYTPPAPGVYVTPSTSEEGASTGMKVLSLLIPLVGLILFLMDKDKKPVAAREELKWAGIGFGIGILLWILLMVAASSLSSSYYY